MSDPVLPSVYQAEENKHQENNKKKRPNQKIPTHLTIENIDSNLCIQKPLDNSINENNNLEKNLNLSKENKVKKIDESANSLQEKNLNNQNLNNKNIIHQEKYCYIRKLIGDHNEATVHELSLCNLKHTSLIKYINNTERKLYCSNCLQGSKNSAGDIREIKEYITSYSDEISKTIKETTEEIERFSFSSCINDNEKLIENISLEFDKYVKMIISLKHLTIQLVQKQLENKEQSFEELMVDISELLEEKSKELRCSFT